MVALDLNESNEKKTLYKVLADISQKEKKEILQRKENNNLVAIIYNHNGHIEM